MWIYSAQLEILILGGLRPIAPCLLPLLGRRVIIAILRSRSQGLDYRSFHSSHTPILTVGSTVELLVGYSGHQPVRHWSGSQSFEGSRSSHAVKLGQQWHCTSPGPQQPKIRPTELPTLPSRGEQCRPS